MPTLRVADAISPALDRTGQLLFRPFNFKRYAAMAVGLWFTMLGQGGGCQFNYSSRSGGGGGPSAADVLKNVSDWVQAHLALTVTIVLVVVIAGFCIYLLYRWLNARGEFMLLDATVGIDGTFKENFSRHATLANTLFKFRIYWDLAIFNYFLIAALIASLFVIPDFRPMFAGLDYRFSGWSITAIVVGVLLFLLAIPLLWLFSNLFYHLAIPLMYVRRMEAWPAFKHAWSAILRPHLGPTLIYFLVMTGASTVEGLAALIGGFAIVILTCCIAVFVSVIPLLGSLVIYPAALTSLPPAIFIRAFALHFLSQLGPDYQTQWMVVPNTGFPVIFTPPADPSAHPTTPPEGVP